MLLILIVPRQLRDSVMVINLPLVGCTVLVHGFSCCHVNLRKQMNNLRTYIRNWPLPTGAFQGQWNQQLKWTLQVKNPNWHTFVANRITTTRDGSTPDQWYHVEGAMNPGDHTSRGLSADAFLNCTEWLLGPEFLWKCELKWPKLTDSLITIPSCDPELKAHATSLVT